MNQWVEVEFDGQVAGSNPSGVVGGFSRPGVRTRIFAHSNSILSSTADFNDEKLPNETVRFRYVM